MAAHDRSDRRRNDPVRRPSASGRSRDRNASLRLRPHASARSRRPGLARPSRLRRARLRKSGPGRSASNRIARLRIARPRIARPRIDPPVSASRSLPIARIGSPIVASSRTDRNARRTSRRRRRTDPIAPARSGRPRRLPLPSGGRCRIATPDRPAKRDPDPSGRRHRPSRHQRRRHRIGTVAVRHPSGPRRTRRRIGRGSAMPFPTGTPPAPVRAAADLRPPMPAPSPPTWRRAYPAGLSSAWTSSRMPARVRSRVVREHPTWRRACPVGRSSRPVRGPDRPPDRHLRRPRPRPHPAPVSRRQAVRGAAVR